MIAPGLVSISFRPLTPDAVITHCQDASLDRIEWGTDAHVPSVDAARAVYEACTAAHIVPASCGSYFKLGVTPWEELASVLSIAQALHTDTVRIWGGNRDSRELSEAALDAMRRDAYRAAELADDYGITLCLECHPHTLTDRYESTLRFLSAVDHPRLATYWQPNQFESLTYNLEAAEALAPMARALHVFAWSATERFPLAAHASVWERYFSIFGRTGRDYLALLEFMPDNDPASLPAEAETLHTLLTPYTR